MKTCLPLERGSHGNEEYSYVHVYNEKWGEMCYFLNWLLELVGSEGVQILFFGRKFSLV